MQEELKKERSQHGEGQQYRHSEAIVETTREYEKTIGDTEKRWKATQGVGEEVSAPYSPLLALSSGSLISLDQSYKEGERHLNDLLEELSPCDGISVTDPLHFTFLAITPNRYANREVFRKEHKDSIEPRAERDTPRRHPV